VCVCVCVGVFCVCVCVCVRERERERETCWSEGFRCYCVGNYWRYRRKL